MEKEVQTELDYLGQGQHPFDFPRPMFLKSWSLYAKRRGVHS